MSKKKLIAVLMSAFVLCSNTAYANVNYSDLDDMTASELEELKGEIETRLSNMNSDSNTDNFTVEENQGSVNETPATDFLYVVNNGETYIRSYKGNASEVVIPYEIEGNVVTNIGEKAFSDNDTLKSVVLPAGIQNVEEEAFSRCDNLSEVVFPKTVTGSLTIGNEAFYNCSIANQLIINCSDLKLGVRAFSLNYDIPAIMLMANSIVFQDSPFSYVKAKVLYINPDAEVTYDGYYLNSNEGDAFAEMEELEELYLPSNTSFLTENTFEGSPKVVVYSQEGASVLDAASALWIPTNYADYAKNTSAIKNGLDEAGYKRVVIYNDSETIKIIQEALNNLGYNCGTPDGISGANTVEQIKKYQKDKGLDETGYITDELLDSLIGDISQE